MRLSLLTAVVAVALVGPVTASEPPVEDISGPWVGEGFVQRDERSNPVKVSCAIEGEQNGERIGFEGVCRAMLVVKREIGASLERAGERLVGTYKGSNLGIAQLDGTENGDGTMELTMTFPREVNGDRSARMVIKRPGNGTFTITTEDEMLSGETVKTSEITFARK